MVRRALLVCLTLLLGVGLIHTREIGAQDIARLQSGVVKITAKPSSGTPNAGTGFGAVQGRMHETVFEGRTVSQAFQGVLCDFFSEMGAGGKTIQGNLTCNNGNSGSFALERQK